MVTRSRLEKIKAEFHPDAVVIFRTDGFYEAFYEDADKIAKLLKLPITKRIHRQSVTLMIGFPEKELEGYLRKLFKSKMTVAIVDMRTEVE